MYRVPERTPFYIDYNYVKNVYKTTSIRAHQDGREPDLTGVLAALNQDLEKVETFYLNRIECIERKKIMLCDRYGILSDSNETPNFINVDRRELQELWTAFGKFLEELKTLQWYCDVNKTGFSMIVSNMGRFQHMNTGQSNKDLFKFDNAQIVCPSTLLHDFEAIDKTMVKLSEAMSESHDTASFSMLLQTFCSRSYLVFDASEAACLAIRKDAASPLDVILDQHYSSTEANENLGFLLFTILLDAYFFITPAASGLAKTCKIYLDYMQDDRHFSVSTVADAVLCRDSEGRTPLYLAVTSGSYNVTNTLLDQGIDKKTNSRETTHESNLQCALDALLPIAVMYDFVEIAELLLAHHANVNGMGTCGETALYIAAQFGRETFLKEIFNSIPLHSVAINLSESARGWSPLIIACVGGFLPTVKCLLEAGADPEHCDYSGWTAQEHAAFRGHLQIAEVLATGIGPQIGENTIQSFLSAAALGASCVEFDVQLTKDLVPVIFHDFLVMEAGGDTPLYTLNLKQFLHLSEAQFSRGDLASMAETRYMAKTKGEPGYSRKPRSHSLGAYDESRSEDLVQRMKYTESAMEGAHKGNLRGQSIQGVFPTFEDLFAKLPESIAFNIEMKYRMLWEAEDRNMVACGPELNIYLDLVLEKIYHLGGKWSITFSSFSPEVCIALAIKQQDYPVLFLNKSGSIPVGDVRCGGLQQSMQFAKRYGLASIVIYKPKLD
ncbi:Glycerophosphocholine phosphodiesterase [Xylographa bjoerkii]|nr:Glycerophosphocholine phosphodiesterase [Xylographa bjoerkii]